MSDITELERRISAALERIARATERRPKAGAAAGMEGAAAPTGTEQSLRDALEAERTANAQLNERVRAIKERQENMISGLERKLARTTEQLDVQGLELQRLRRANAQLMEANRRLVAAQEEGESDSGAVNRALQAELEGLRAARRSEMAELEQIMGELKPLIGETANG